AEPRPAQQRPCVTGAATGKARCEPACCKCVFAVFRDLSSLAMLAWCRLAHGQRGAGEGSGGGSVNAKPPAGVTPIRPPGEEPAARPPAGIFATRPLAP